MSLLLSVERHIDRCGTCREQVSKLVKMVDVAQASTHARRGPERLESGDAVGRYVVIETLGVGGMGAVYLARDPKLDRPVALKVLHPRVHARNTELQERLQREAQLMARLNHPHVAAVHDVGSDHDRTFVVMEYLPGGTLRRWLIATHHWREILAVFLDAGRGLAAAHAAGIVHRDFKPENVLFGHDNRVVVTDLGLAQHGALHASASPTLDDRLPSLDAPRVSAPMHASGTPRYMGPEQLRLSPVDARVDQFSFCVALAEALFGCHPYGVGGDKSIAAAIREGRLRPFPVSPRVPRSIRRALVRGLAPDPGDRYPTMEDLLAAISRPTGLARPWVKSLLWAVTALVLLALGAWRTNAFGREDPNARCQQGSERFADVWNAKLSERLREAASATSLPLAEDAYKTASETFDEYGRAWVAAYHEACEATHVHGVQSQRVLELRIECLEQRSGELDAVIRAISASSDPAHFTSVVDAASGLSDVRECAQAERQLIATALSSDPEKRQAVTTTRDLLNEARALLLLGEPREGLTAALEATDLAQPLDDVLLLAAAHFTLARLQESVADEQASANYELAAAKAQLGSDDLLVAKSWLGLMRLATRSADYTGANDFAERADFALVRVGTDADMFGRLAKQRGDLASATGEFGEAQEHFERALQLWDGEDLRDRARAMEALGGLVDNALQRGLLRDAHAYLDRALSLSEAAYGPSHPTYAALRSKLGNVLHRQGDSAEAIEHHRAALTILQSCFGSNHPRVALAHENLAVTLDAIGRFEAAQQHYEAALEILRSAHGPDHPLVGAALQNLAGIYLESGSYDRAQALYSQALQILTESLPVNHPFTLSVLGNLAGIAVRTQDYDAAQRLYERVYRERIATLGAHHHDVGYPLNGLGEVWLARGDTAQAKRYYNQATDLWSTALGPTHPILAFPHLGLGQCALLERDPERAHAAFLRALELRSGPDVAAHQKAEVEAWLLRTSWELSRTRRRGPRGGRQVAPLPRLAPAKMPRRSIGRGDRGLIDRGTRQTGL